MRFETEFDFILKIRDAQGLPDNPVEGESYEFQKTIDRVYALNIPILLCDDDHKVYGKVIITEYTAGGNVTKGKYTIVKLFDEEKSKLWTEDLLETVQIMKERKA
ncbi:MAG: hypothetical protein OXR66_06130 [Candidatus Woesearchaeota archaeon]|nr:hypothetical protein [Candidatus Woesearchaeota archaeon]